MLQFTEPPKLRDMKRHRWEGPKIPRHRLYMELGASSGSPRPLFREASVGVQEMTTRTGCTCPGVFGGKVGGQAGRHTSLSGQQVLTNPPGMRVEVGWLLGGTRRDLQQCG